jgi:hypothetical protein
MKAKIGSGLGIGGMKSHLRRIEIEGIAGQVSYLSKNTIIEEVFKHPKKYSALAALMNSVTMERAVKTARMMKLGAAIRLIRQKIKGDPVPGRSYPVFLSVPLAHGKWGLKPAQEVMGNEDLRLKYFDRLAVAEVGAKKRRKLYVEYIKIAGHMAGPTAQWKKT